MPTYVHDPATRTMVKVCDRVVRAQSWQEEDTPFARKIMNGYRKVEEKGERFYGKPANIKKIWGIN